MKIPRTGRKRVKNQAHHQEISLSRVSNHPIVLLTNKRIKLKARVTQKCSSNASKAKSAWKDRVLVAALTSLLATNPSYLRLIPNPICTRKPKIRTKRNH